MEISIVIPAYNEERYISNVLNSLKTNDIIKEIIVVNDGSTDNTSALAKAFTKKVYDLPQNIGKGGAMYFGAKMATSKYVLFLDADLINLQERHINELALPVIDGQFDMSIGVFEKGRATTDVAQFFAPFLSGQRCLSREFFLKVSNVETSRFGVEVALTRYAQKHNLRIKEVVLDQASHVMKEEKLGIVKGFLYRLKMYWEIAKNVRTGGF